MRLPYVLLHLSSAASLPSLPRYLLAGGAGTSGGGGLVLHKGGLVLQWGGHNAL